MNGIKSEGMEQLDATIYMINMVGRAEVGKFSFDHILRELCGMVLCVRIGYTGPFMIPPHEDFKNNHRHRIVLQSFSCYI